MPTINILIESKIEHSVRMQQLGSLFDMPIANKQRLHWEGEAPFEEKPWSIGAILGPSGSGKSVIAKDLFDNYHPELSWGENSVIDEIKDHSLSEITEAFSTVGFGTIPAWLRPYAVLSNGEKFRCDVARRLLTLDDPIIIDEFTSVVDRQVAKIGCHAIQKYVRRKQKKLVVVSCHHDIEDWLQPDWVLEPSSMSFRWRLLQRRPEIQCVFSPVKYDAWQLFSKYHYMSNELNRSARCFGLFVNDLIVSFCAVMHRPHPKVKNIKGISRMVTLPDWQGLGMAFILAELLGSMYKACGYRFRNYPAHPSYVRSHLKNVKWIQTKRAGTFSSRNGSSGSIKLSMCRPSAVFEYIGEAYSDIKEAKELLGLT